MAEMMTENRRLFTHCGDFFMKGDSADGFSCFKRCDCGRPWCPICGKRTQMRRFSRMLPKALKIDSMTYLVQTYPEDEQPRTQEALRQDRELLCEALEIWGVKELLGRTHFFGDEEPEEILGEEPEEILGEEPEEEPDWKPRKQHTHNNVLFEGGFLEPEEFESLKIIIRLKMCLPENGDIYIHYSTKIGKKVHWLKYINRNTFLNPEWDLELCDEFFNKYKMEYNRKTRDWDKKQVIFKNSFSRGNVRLFKQEWGFNKKGKLYQKYEMGWAGKDKWALDESHVLYGYIAKIQRGVSPLSGAKIRWGVRSYRREEIPGDYEKIWTGVYQRNPPFEIVQRYRALQALERALRSPPKEACAGGVI